MTGGISTVSADGENVLHSFSPVGNMSERHAVVSVGLQMKLCLVDWQRRSTWTASGSSVSGFFGCCCLFFFLLLHPIVHLPFFLVLCFCLFHFGTNHVSGSPFLPFALPIISQLFQFHFNSVPPSSFSLYRLVSLQVGRLGRKKTWKKKWKKGGYASFMPLMPFLEQGEG